MYTSLAFYHDEDFLLLQINSTIQAIRRKYDQQQLPK